MGPRVSRQERAEKIGQMDQECRMAEWPFCSIGSRPARANSRVSLQCSRRFTRVGEPLSALPCAFGGLPAHVDCRAHCNIQLGASSRAVFGRFP